MAGIELDLNSLILQVIERQGDCDVLDRLEAACSTARDLGDVADRLVTYFVNEARDGGLSWTLIGERMGITKQAARKRYVPRDIPDEPSVLRERIYGRYTDRAKHVIVLAQSQAKAHHHHYIGTEHILLGICHEPEGVAARVIESCGVGLETLAVEMTLRLLPPSGEVPDRPPFTAKAKKVLELTARKARQLGHEWIGTEHLLLGLIIERTGLAADVLMDSGITRERAERETLRIMAESRQGGGAPSMNLR
jgi:Clp amino terminal domain, pathogenicity island component